MTPLLWANIIGVSLLKPKALFLWSVFSVNIFVHLHLGEVHPSFQISHLKEMLSKLKCSKRGKLPRAVLIWLSSSCAGSCTPGERRPQPPRGLRPCWGNLPWLPGWVCWKPSPPVVASVAFQSQLPARLCPHSCTRQPSHEKSPSLEFGAHYRERGGGGEGFHGVKHSISKHKKGAPIWNGERPSFHFSEK